MSRIKWPNSIGTRGQIPSDQVAKFIGIGTYRSPGFTRLAILEKEVVDEVIFRTIKPRNRLILKLMARGGMRISEVLQLTHADIEDHKLTLRAPKSGKGSKMVFIPKKVSDPYPRKDPPPSPSAVGQ